MRKVLNKNFRLKDEQINKLKDLSAFDGSDPLVHVTKAIDEYLDKQTMQISSPKEKEIHAEIKDRSRDPRISGALWVSGNVGKYEFSALILAEPSKSGIDRGRISKLSILDPVVREKTKSFIGSCIVNYDRGWDIRPSKIAEPFYNRLRILVDQIAK
ncbi:DUF7678 domain-containing protein [Dyadobacter arcticus]|uniref:DUF7678 domain-containing protein n=1 Tax=Dyadobacter arcticus TaxID=1078754 RepID=A0ABX0UKA0_9BACT|nr:hypothetical protein [Dyadobacter arcticus]NIJ52499.1 hypothetical protein [Dyadobacter arcticus]